MPTDPLTLRIADSPLPPRAKHRLCDPARFRWLRHHAPIETVGDLVKLPPSRLLMRPGFGRKSLDAVIDWLESLDLRLAPDFWERQQQKRQQQRAAS